MGRVFANGPGDLGLIPGHFIQKTLKMELDTSLLSTQQYKALSRVKWNNPGKGVEPSLTPQCRSYWKVSLLVTLDYGCQLYLLNGVIYRKNLANLANLGIQFINSLTNKICFKEYNKISSGFQNEALKYLSNLYLFISIFFLSLNKYMYIYMYIRAVTARFQFACPAEKGKLNVTILIRYGL